MAVKDGHGGSTGGVTAFSFQVLDVTLQKSWFLLKSEEHQGKALVFQGLARVRAPESEPLGPQNHAQIQSGRTKVGLDRLAGEFGSPKTHVS